MNKPEAVGSAPGLVDRARAIAPLISAEADEIERTRRLTPKVVSALVDNGLYRSLLPKSFGGFESPPLVFMEMLEEIAKADASTAWCLGQCSVVAMTAAYLDADVARQVFGKPTDIMAWGAIAHDVQAVPGGYTISARWDFASGSRQANWLGAHVQVLESDGTRRIKPNGTPEIRTIVFPASSATMHDVWNVIGLCGTGTDSYSVENLFIPENFAALRDDFTALREKGPLYGLTTYTMFGLGFGAVSLGVARATLDAAVDLARKKHSVGIAAMRDNNSVQGLIGRTEAKLRAARAYHYSTASEAWQELLDTGRLSEKGRAAIRLSATYTIHQAAEVVDTAYHMAGATAVFKSNPFERRFRDMHAIAQQIQARDNHYEDVGKMILTNSVIPRGPTV
ncbi:acyl-CoA dehydrogenase family protein [Bradyrhizobium sp.]|uniref:acyl-CoA dehydrogenase family protein n=1 Tax=Bradyrhizobium sp. TaxID=376 RepID=UPI00238DC098|nr:acyl-CoA dehydrogenase family protein [Bradyrhizobium sp.]MDE1935297.1 acyl-CoA dehydrogenase [Bradyrhizobium sp.]MDE2063898.1 acyl-CoA dehydrogenase [Bradyrhizobium sp.]